MPKISIIVPVYKVEQYIRRCLDSIVAQTFTDWECLLIDDGSPDESGKICDEYAERDARFRVFHKENGGVSSARNLGLEEAKGEWICFVDSDDWIEYNYLPIDINELEIFDIIELSNSCHSIGDVELLNSSRVVSFYSDKFRYELWARLFKSNIINSLRFVESIKIGEDILFLLSYLPKVKTLKSVKGGLYNYYINDSSVMNKPNISLIKEQQILLLNQILENHLYESEFAKFFYVSNFNYISKIYNDIAQLIYSTYPHSFWDLLFCSINLRPKIRFVINVIKLHF